MTLGLPLSYLAIKTLTAGLWFIPAFMVTIAYFKYEQIDPEGKPYNVKQLHKEYDFIVGKKEGIT